MKERCQAEVNQLDQCDTKFSELNLQVMYGRQVEEFMERSWKPERVVGVSVSIEPSFTRLC